MTPFRCDETVWNNMSEDARLAIMEKHEIELFNRENCSKCGEPMDEHETYWRCNKCGTLLGKSADELEE